MFLCTHTGSTTFKYMRVFSHGTSCLKFAPIYDHVVPNILNSEPGLLTLIIAFGCRCPMDYPQECVCGRSFTQVNAMSHHRRTCKKSKTRLASALSLAQENWSRKKARRNEEKIAPSAHIQDLYVMEEIPTPDTVSPF